MADMMDEIHQRANLAFSNAMEMLTFFLTDSQQYGINVFKIIEVLETPDRVTKMPQAHEAVVGAIDFRDRAVAVIDLAMAMGMPPVDRSQVSYIIICEYSNSTQGFLISHPNKLLTKSWSDIHTPGEALSNAGYLTAITYDEAENPIQILDIEKILGEIVGIEDTVAQELVAAGRRAHVDRHRVMVVDDSKAARALLQSTLEQLGVAYEIHDGAEKALHSLESSAASGEGHAFSLIISDIEMPGMDGFTFTRKVKSNPSLAPIHLVLHSSMSNQANRIKAEQVGANDFIPKFQPNEIARVVLNHLQAASA